jgi:hypothetical protein
MLVSECLICIVFRYVHAFELFQTAQQSYCVRCTATTAYVFLCLIVRQPTAEWLPSQLTGLYFNARFASHTIFVPVFL